MAMLLQPCLYNEISRTTTVLFCKISWAPGNTVRGVWSVCGKDGLSKHDVLVKGFEGYTVVYVYTMTVSCLCYFLDV